MQRENFWVHRKTRKKVSSNENISDGPRNADNFYGSVTVCVPSSFPKKFIFDWTDVYFKNAAISQNISVLFDSSESRHKIIISAFCVDRPLESMLLFALKVNISSKSFSCLQLCCAFMNGNFQLKTN